MKKLTRVVSILMVMLMLLSAVAVSPISATTMTESEFNALLQKFQANEYADGSTYKNNNSNVLGSQCFGYANYLATYIFGSFPASDMSGVNKKEGWTITHGAKAIDNLHVGDIVRYKYHSIFIVKIDGEDVYCTEANYDHRNGVRWNAKTTKTRLKELVALNLTSGPSSINGKQYTGWVAHYNGWESTQPTCGCSDSYAGTYICATESTTLNIRSGHGTSYSVIGSIPRGATVTVTEGSSEWAHVTYNGVSGYASMDYLEKQEPEHAQAPTIDWWLSDSECGESVDTYKAGDSGYLCYKLYDEVTGKSWDEVESADYTVSLILYNPDGSVKDINSSTFDCDEGCVSVLFSQAGTYKIDIAVEGDYDLSETYTFTVSENPKEIHTSVDSLNLTFGGARATTIYVWTSGYYANAEVISKSSSNSNISTAWGEKTADGLLPITITANSAGSTILTLSVKDEKTGAVLATTTINVTVTARTYTVSYNANGGSGAPTSQTKYHGTDLTLSSAAPTRLGYTFKGWATSSTATSVTYQPGDKFSTNDNVTLYAVWSANLTGISVSTAPNKTIYNIGEALDTSGMVVTLKYADGTTKAITRGFSVSGFSSATVGEKTVTVSYDGFISIFMVTVINPDVDFEIKSVSRVISGDKIIFTVITTPNCNRVKVTKADDLASYISYSSDYVVNADGNYVFTLSVPRTNITTKYAFDGRRVDTNRYAKGYYYTTVSVEQSSKPATILSATHKVSDGKIIFTVVTKPGDFSRIKVTTADNLGGSLGVADTYTINAEGNYVWTVKATEPSENTNYAFDLRSASTTKYLKKYFYYDVEATTPTILSASHTVSNGKIIFTVVTKPGDFSRIKVTTADSLGGSLGVADTYTINADGNYVWTVKATEPSENTNYAFDLRNATTSKYLKEYFYYEAVAATPAILSASYTVSSGKIIFTVVTKAGNYDRIKATLATNLGGSIAVGTTYTVDKNGNYVWTIKATAPTSNTNYAFDLRVAGGKYQKEYFYYNV